MHTSKAAMCANWLTAGHWNLSALRIAVQVTDALAVATRVDHPSDIKSGNIMVTMQAR